MVAMTETVAPVTTAPMFGSYRLYQWRERRRARALLRAAKQAVARFPLVPYRRGHGLAGPLVVSLTSYPARFATLGATIRSLLDQTVQPDRTILWVGHKDLSSLPTDVRSLVSHGLEIRGCHDVRSYTKLIPALAAFPNAYHVTADDDIYYPPDWLARLVDTVDPARPAVIAMRAHLAGLDADGRLRPYTSWQLATASCGDTADGLLFPTGVAGVLYPPDALSSEVHDEATFLRLAPRADDVWFFWMARRRGTAQVRVPGSFDLVTWPSSQAVGLLNDNLMAGGNDRQIRAVEEAIGPVLMQRQATPGLPVP
jgi:hypothetical protein